MYSNNHDNSVYCAEDNLVKLGNAIILQAVKDYRDAIKRLSVHPNNSTALSTKREVERFFHSGLYSIITNVDPDMLIIKLNQEVDCL